MTKNSRINEEIRCPEIRVIDAEGKQLGVMIPKEALKLAIEHGLDLVEVAPNAQPPVCRIMDYGKFKYQQSKKTQATHRKRAHGTDTLKEVKIRPMTDDHDLDIKVRNMKKFLAGGSKTKISLQFRGREIAYAEMAKNLMARVAEQIKDVGVIEQEPKLEGRQMIMIVAPKS